MLRITTLHQLDENSEPPELSVRLGLETSEPKYWDLYTRTELLEIQNRRLGRVHWTRNPRTHVCKIVKASKSARAHQVRYRNAEL